MNEWIVGWWICVSERASEWIECMYMDGWIPVISLDRQVGSMDECVYVWVNECMYACVSEWVSRVNIRMNEWIYVCMINDWLNQWLLNECMSGWVYVWVDEWIKWMIADCMHVCMIETEWMSESNVWVSKWIKCMHDWLNKWVSDCIKWVNEWMNEWVSE